MVDTRFRKNHFQIVVSGLENTLSSSNWRLRYVSTSDLATSLLRNWEFVDEVDLDNIVGMLYDPVIEVRDSACKSLSELFGILPQGRLAGFVERFKRDIEEVQEGAENGAILGLVSIIEGYDTIMPEWFPKLLLYLAQFKNLSGQIGNAVRVCLSGFWQRHKITWEHEKEKFTAEQIEAISEHVNPYNYYA